LKTLGTYFPNGCITDEIDSWDEVIFQLLSQSKPSEQLKKDWRRVDPNRLFGFAIEVAQQSNFYTTLSKGQ
jgi:hypothetical protein